ncbi:ribosomal protein S5 domain 2-like protein [Lentinula edodes]|uniref:Ribosomal protein S5 domain 2-like protein n=1 Tax=Lentinula edodes TaxID=5353 RepID=A0A1Q3E583_LENED|nr:ribosomal protein S5 domain 2-like protein [Lentinula edodes]
MQSVFDRRRINGPEDSSAPIFADEHQKSLTPDLYKDRHNRSVSDIRPIFLQPGLISQANGSAYIETDRTKIACSVYGPRQSKNTAYNEKASEGPTSEDRSIAVAIQQALLSSVRLEHFPKSTIDIFLVIIEADGIEGCVASGSIAASTALADAGIDMYGLVTSCTAGKISGLIQHKKSFSMFRRM